MDSRAGDPLLHTHVTVANAVQADDGVWRTIDSASLLRATVAASETYNVLVADAVTRRPGMGWERRGREGRDRNPGRELAAVGQDLVDELRPDRRGSKPWRKRRWPRSRPTAVSHRRCGSSGGRSQQLPHTIAQSYARCQTPPIEAASVRW